MKSSFTAGNATLKHEVSEITYRNEPFKYVRFFYECDDTKEHFTTTELDEMKSTWSRFTCNTKPSMACLVGISSKMRNDFSLFGNKSTGLGGEHRSYFTMSQKLHEDFVEITIKDENIWKIQRFSVNLQTQNKEKEVSYVIN